MLPQVENDQFDTFKIKYFIIPSIKKEVYFVERKNES